jgi:hypothetical protein
MLVREGERVGQRREERRGDTLVREGEGVGQRREERRHTRSQPAQEEKGEEDTGDCETGEEEEESAAACHSQ